MFGRTLADGQHHEVRWEAIRLDRTIESVRTCGRQSLAVLEIHSLVQQVVVITDDRCQWAAEIAGRTAMDVEDILATPVPLHRDSR